MGDYLQLHDTGISIFEGMDMTVEILSNNNCLCNSVLIRNEIIQRIDQANKLTPHQDYFGEISAAELNKRLRNSRSRLKELGLIKFDSGDKSWKLTELGCEISKIGKASKVQKLKTAWLITWSGTDTFPKPGIRFPWVDENNEIVAIINGNRNRDYVLEIMKCLYGRSFGSVKEIVSNIKKYDLPPIEHVSGGVNVGHMSLYLHGRRVTELLVVPEFDDCFEHVYWTEPDIWKYGSNPYECRVERGKNRWIRRRSDKVGLNPFGRKTN